MSEFVLRDERGHPLTSIFHEVPKKENNFIMIHSDKYWEDLNRELLKLFDLNFTITEFHPDDIEETMEDLQFAQDLKDGKIEIKKGDEEQ